MTTADSAVDRSKIHVGERALDEKQNRLAFLAAVAVKKGWTPRDLAFADRIKAVAAAKFSVGWNISKDYAKILVDAYRGDKWHGLLQDNPYLNASDTSQKKEDQGGRLEPILIFGQVRDKHQLMDMAAAEAKKRSNVTGNVTVVYVDHYNPELNCHFCVVDLCSRGASFVRGGNHER